MAGAPIERTESGEEVRFIGFNVVESMASSLDELATRRYSNRSELIREALSRFLADEDAAGEPELVGAHRGAVRLPGSFSGTQRRVYDHLVAAGQPLRTAQLAELLGIHPGNIDRALRPLRDSGHVETLGRGFHQISVPDDMGDQGVAATG